MPTVVYYLVPAHIAKQFMQTETIDELLEDNEIIEIETGLSQNELKDFMETIDINNC